MRILVLGTGQGGTSLLVEAVRGLNVVSFTSSIGDSEFFNHEVLPQDYGTKLTTDCIEKITRLNFSSFLKNIEKSMKKHADLHIVFSLRHPVDVFMAQLVRGQKPSDGGDGEMKKERVSDTGTINGSLFAISHAHNIYKNILPLFPERIITVKLENLVLMPETEVNRIARFLESNLLNEHMNFINITETRTKKEDTAIISISPWWLSTRSGIHGMMDSSRRDGVI